MMHDRILKLVLFTALGWMLMQANASAFVPTGDHLLYLVAGAISQPHGMTVTQTRRVIDNRSTDQPVIEIEETLFYKKPDMFRSNSVSGDGKQGICIQKGNRFLRVQEGVVVSFEQTLADHYNSVLIFRTSETLHSYLDHIGVDTETTSLQRDNDRVMVVIGKSPQGRMCYSSLWVDQDTFFPRKLIINRDGTRAEIYYDSWQRVSRTWYPLEISIFLNQRLFSLIHVNTFELTGDLSDSLFDIDTLVDLYPRSVITESDSTDSEVEELDRKIEEFEKLFE